MDEESRNLSTEGGKMRGRSGGLQKRPSSLRVATWLVVAAVGVHLLGSGLIGILSGI